MPQRDETPAGAPCWIDLMSSDPAGSRAFYGELLGWTAEEGSEEFGGYFNFSKDGRLVAGGMSSAGQPGPSDMWSVYLATDDADRTVAVAEANGGSVLVPPMKVAELGTMAVLTDAGGAAVGVWQPGLHKGFAVVGEPGAPSWFEVLTRDYDATVGFYRNVFGWDIQVMDEGPELRYSTRGAGETASAGIMDASGFLPEGVPAHWSVYFDVTDADAALVKTVELGGSIVRPAEDTPYGRIAQAADANGAHFKIRAV